MNFMISFVFITNLQPSKDEPDQFKLKSPLCIGWRIFKWSFEYTPPFIIWNNKVKNVKNIANLFKLLLYICWFQKEPFFNLFLDFKFFIRLPDIAAQFHLKFHWICLPSFLDPRQRWLLEVRREETCFLSLVLSRRRNTGSMVN